jgi:hypothetical protein
MPASIYNIICEQGATLERNLTFRDGNGLLVNLTGFSAQMQVRPTVTSSTVTLELSTLNNRIVLGGQAGTITLNVPATTTATLAPGDFVYDLELTSPNGVVRRLVEGKFKVKPEVTR